MTDKIRKLETELKAASSREKADLLNKLASTYLNTSAKKTLEYAEQALKLSNESSDQVVVT